MLTLSGKVLSRLPLPKWPWPFQSGPRIGTYDGCDVEWSGLGVYGLRRTTGTEHYAWLRVPKPECYDEYWRRSTMTLSVVSLTLDKIGDLDSAKVAEWDAYRSS